MPPNGGTTIHESLLLHTFSTPTAAVQDFHSKKEALISEEYQRKTSFTTSIFSCFSIICIRFKGSKPYGLLSGSAPPRFLTEVSIALLFFGCKYRYSLPKEKLRRWVFPFTQLSHFYFSCFSTFEEIMTSAAVILPALQTR